MCRFCSVGSDRSSQRCQKWLRSGCKQNSRAAASLAATAGAQAKSKTQPKPDHLFVQSVAKGMGVLEAIGSRPATAEPE